MKKMIKVFSIVKGDTFALGISNLKSVPFSFEDNVKARLEDSNLFNIYLDSVTGMAFKKGSSKFKIKVRCGELINIKSDFNESFLSVNYDDFIGVELDRLKMKCNEDLTREEAKAHKGWLVLMNGNQALLNKYVDFWFNKTNSTKGMTFYVRSKTDNDELRSVVLGDVYYDSYAGGDNYLFSSAQFVSVSPKKSD